MSKIECVEIHVFQFEVDNLGLAAHSAAGVGNLIHIPGSKLKAQRFAVRIRCDDGAQGEYVTHWVGTPSTLGPVADAGARSDRPRPGTARADLRRSKTRGARL